jgi:galactoside O-acetyltransferase
MKTSFYTEQEISQLGLKSYGKNVLISRYAQIYSPEKISIGDNVRIDDFCILSGRITIGSHIHIAAYCAMYGADYSIVMEDYTGLSARATIYAAMDDFSGEYLIGPIHDDKYTNVTGGKVCLRKYSQIGVGSVVFPNIQIGEGSVVGAMSLVKQNLDEWGIYAGIPICLLKKRSKNLLRLLD